jgi:hypothetical protein
MPLKNGFLASLSATKQVELGIIDISITMSSKLGCVETIIEFFIFFIFSISSEITLIIPKFEIIDIYNFHDFCRVLYLSDIVLLNGKIKYVIKRAPTPIKAKAKSVRKLL